MQCQIQGKAVLQQGTERRKVIASSMICLNNHRTCVRYSCECDVAFCIMSAILSGGVLCFV